MQRGISTITVPIFTRLLTSSEYGQISVYNSWQGIVSVFVSLNLTAGVYMRGLVAYEEKRKEFISSMQALCFTLIACWFGVYLVFSEFWNGLFKLTTPLMLLMFAEIWIASVFGFWAAEQRVDYHYKKLVVLTLTMSVLTPCLGVYLVINSDDKVFARIFSGVILHLLCYVWFFFSQLKRGKTFFSKEFWKYALSFNLPLIPHYLSMIILSSSDRIMIANMVDNRSAGIYNLAYAVSMVLTMFNGALMSTVEPWLYKKLKANDLEPLPKIAYPTFALIAGINIGLIAFAPEIISFFAPKEYYEAIWIVPPVAMSVYFMFSYSYFAVFEFYYKKTGYIATATMVGAVLNIILNYVFIRKYGYYAAGYTTLVCYIAYGVAHYCFMRKICRENLGGARVYSLRTLLSITAVFMAIGFVFLFVYGNNAYRYSLIALFAIITMVYSKEVKNSVLNLVKIKQDNKHN